MQSIVYSVSEITGRLKDVLETRFGTILIRGEVSGVHFSNAGHTYFTLKDATAQLSCVWFSGKRAQYGKCRIDPLTGEVFAPGSGVTIELLQQGGEFLCSGKLSFYARSGTCQLVVDNIVPSGLGVLTQAFEARKEALAKKGYFAKERKRPIPKNPSKVALITSEQGAAIHDFLRIAENRGLSSEIRLFPTLVQGVGAAFDISRAIKEAGAQGWAEVIVVIRGGGSFEDLFCFNEEIVAEAIFSSPVPVLAGIGHEVDVTLADMTADLRAATPTHAAELLWDARSVLAKHVDDLCGRLDTLMGQRLARLAERLSQEERALSLASPKNRLRFAAERLAQTDNALKTAFLAYFARKEEHFLRVQERLRASFSDEFFQGRLLSVHDLARRLRFQTESLLAERESLLARRTETLIRAFEAWLLRTEHALDRMDVLLAANHPKALLKRGYALVEKENGEVVKGVCDVAAFEQLTLLLHDGRIRAEVLDAAPYAKEDAKATDAQPF